MNPVQLIALVNELLALAPKGVSLYAQVRDLLAAIDDPAAKEALAGLEATYAESAQLADQAIDDALARLPPDEPS